MKSWRKAFKLSILVNLITPSTAKYFNKRLTLNMTYNTFWLYWSWLNFKTFFLRNFLSFILWLIHRFVQLLAINVCSSSRNYPYLCISYRLDWIWLVKFFALYLWSRFKMWFWNIDLILLLRRRYFIGKCYDFGSVNDVSIF